MSPFEKTPIGSHPCAWANTGREDVDDWLGGFSLVSPPPTRGFLKHLRLPTKSITTTQYKDIVIEELRNIIEADFVSIALNSVFGSFWRMGCNECAFLGRLDLNTRFASSIDRLRDAEQRAPMKNWLEKSSQFAADILHTLEAVLEDQRYPRVFLDPTTEF
ncbi:hypothetical protein PMIN06_000503 [Paraphaeosphaeria minitans]